MNRSRHAHVDMFGQVNSLKANLDERYKEFFCIIQELLQNADDAGSKNIIIGQLDHLSDKHPLGNTPGIFVINDGPVTQSDLDQIFNIAASNKNQDNTKVGKFGLGMKSVLHICETFFVFARLTNGHDEVDFFDPWDPCMNEDIEKMPDPHPSWRNEFEGRKDVFLQEAKNELGKYLDIGENWFALWLPLRRYVHCAGAGALLDYYPGEDGAKEWLTEADCRKISEMFPFFKNLRKVTFAAGWLKKFGTLEMVPENQTGFKGDCKNEWMGTIRSDRNIHNELKYHGWEWVCPEMEAMKKDPEWPMVQYWDEARKDSCRKADKTAPHAAVCFCSEQLPGGMGQMKLQQCVFFPLSDMTETKSLALPCNLTISFHGQFFIDAGRRSYKLEDDKPVKSIKIQWNCKLLFESLLPKIPHHLSAFFAKWEIEELKTVIRTFCETDFWKGHRSYLCKKDQYLLRLTKNGWKWEVCRASEKFLKLPDAGHPALLKEIFHRINKDHLLVRDDAEILSIGSAREWSPEQSSRIWAAVNTLQTAERYDRITLSFLSRFVTAEVKDYTQQTDGIKKYLTGMTLEQYRAGKGQLGDILRQYPHRNIAFAQTWTGKSFDLWKKILNSAVYCLPLDLPVTSDPSFRYSCEDMKKILPELEKELNAGPDEACSSVLHHLICDCLGNSEVKNWLGSEFAKYRLVETKEGILSLKEFDGKRHMSLFANGGDVSLLSHLQNAVTIKISRLTQDYSEVLSKIGLEIKPFHVSFLKTIFDRSLPELKPTQKRIDLLNDLLSNDDDDMDLPIRYILHGNKKYYQYTGDIWIPDLPLDDTYKDGMKLLSCLQQEKSQPSLPIDQVFIDNMRNKDLNRLNIKKRSVSDLIAELNGYPEADRIRLCKAWITPETWVSLASCPSLGKQDFDICAVLPIWPCRDGQYRELSKCFLEDDIAIPDILSGIPILDVENPEQTALLREKFRQTKIWQDEDTIRDCTRLPDSSRAAEILWETINTHDHEPDWPHEPELRKSLYHYPLLELQTGKRICFLQVMEHFDWQKKGIYQKSYLTDGSLRNWTRLVQKNWHPDPQDWILFLCERLKDDPDFSFGALREYGNADQLEKLFSNGKDLMPVFDLLADLKGKISPDDFLRRFDGCVPEAGRLGRICTYLSRSWEDSQDTSVMELLKYFAGLADTDFDWSDVELPNCLNHARKCSQMICYAEGVDREYILHENLRGLFPDTPADTLSDSGQQGGKLTEEEYQQIILMNSAADHKAEFEQQHDDCGKLLEDYFKDWPEELEHQIGAFLRLFGEKNHDVKELAQNYELSLTGEQLQNKISRDFKEMMDKHYLMVHIYSGTTHKMRPLGGTQLIEVPSQADTERESLLFGDETRNCQDRRHYIYMALQRVDANHLETGLLEKLLIRTVQVAVRKLNQPDGQVSTLFDDFVKETEQFDLKITRKLILKELPSNLRQMALRSDNQLKILLNKYDSCIQRIEQAKSINDKLNQEKYEAEKELILEELESCFTDPAKAGIKEETLNAVKRRISKEVYGYDLNSIPFELFQNADDAAAELQMMQGISPEDRENFQPFFIEIDGNALNVIHRGRPINQFKMAGFRPKDGEKMGFDKDLWRMLLIGVSDKTEAGLKRTGKFGLGFKSIFLLTDVPLVSSNKFFFSIQGGLMPEFATDDEKNKLKEIAGHADSVWPADRNKNTVFHLPFRPGKSFELDKFKKAAPLLVLFSRKINAVCINDSHGPVLFAEKNLREKYLVWDLDTIRLAMGKCDDLPAALPERTATIWVTVPTAEDENFGFAVNGDFRLDVGRNHLYDCGENAAISEKAAAELFCHLASEFSKQQPVFWERLWDLFSNGNNSGLWSSLRTRKAIYQVLGGLFWGSCDVPSGYGKFIRKYPVVPSGLPGKFDRLVALDHVKTVIRKDLSDNWDLFAPFAEKQNWEPGTLVQESIEKVLSNVYGRELNNVDHYDIARLMQEYGGSHPDLPPDILNRSQGWKAFFEQCGNEVQKNWPRLLGQVKFLNRKGKYCLAESLLIRNDNSEEESLRAAFAPDTAVISPDYTPEALEFFRRVRGEMSVPVHTLVEWAVHAAKNGHKETVFNYFGKGGNRALISGIFSAAGPDAPWLKEWQKKHLMESAIIFPVSDDQDRDDGIQKTVNPDDEKSPWSAYSFGWFKFCLDEEIEEIQKQFPNGTESKEFSIAFTKVERETDHILVLYHPDRDIPSYLEDLDNIPLKLYSNDLKKPARTVMIEVASIKNYSLSVKLKPGTGLADIDLQTIKRASITFKNPVFLLDELKKQFEKLSFRDEDDLQKQLCANIEFIFGPPGTGKTTYLASERLIPLMQQDENKKVLVLAPTNKAADVLVSRIMESFDVGDPPDWLVRFGTTLDERIAESGVFKERTFDIRQLKRNVTVTTIARLPYDTFQPADGIRLSLRELQWDYVVIDEASMIPLINIIYPLYKISPEKFIIAGDPLQIEPITHYSEWKQENIYTMVKLNSFSEPHTYPREYPVVLLKKQYRSIPVIGEIFSAFSYGGLLSHARGMKDQRPLLLKSGFSLKPLNILSFPVEKEYEKSIYHLNRLNDRSPYQIYSALFAFEFAKYIAEELDCSCREKVFRIGIISPYRVQTDLIDKLLARTRIPPYVSIQAGTVHGFQGDECEMIIALFNPPPRASSGAYVNKKNIINVAVSRARDYLVVLTPESGISSCNNLQYVCQLCRVSGCCDMFSTHGWEEIMFSSPDFLEENSFSTGHQSVNVYGEPEKRYEIRSENSSLDIQIHVDKTISIPKEP